MALDIGVPLGAVVGAAVWLGAAVGAVDATGTGVEARVTGSETEALGVPPEIALTPVRFCQADAPSTIPPLTT